MAILLLSVADIGQARAQTPYRGTVVGKVDGLPVIAAAVETADGRVRTRTDLHGRFTMAIVPGDTVRVRALGYMAIRFVPHPGDSILVIEPLPTLLAAVTTTAGQRTIRANESTADVTVVDRSELDAAGAISANQVLRQLPGLQELPSEPSKSTIAIRGLDAARVLVLVDGEPVPGALIDNRDIGRLSSVAAERIEITKGPSGVEFGSDALGGVINLVTASPSKTLAVDATGRVGQLGRRESTVDISNTVGSLGFRLSGGWRQVDRLVGVDASGSSLDRVYDIRSDMRYRATDNLALRGDVQLSQERQRWPVGGGYNGFIDNHGAQAFVEAQEFALGGTIRARMSGQYYNYEFRQSQQLLPIAGSADSLEQREQLARGLLSYTRAFGAHTIDAGVQLSSRAIVAPQKIDGDRASDRVTESFARDAWTAGPVLMTLGARLTSSSLWGRALTPSAGAAWQVTQSVRVRANESRGFRGPSFKEIGYTFSNPAAGYIIVGNRDLAPESSWTTDLGATWAPAAMFALDVSAYQNRVSNLIDTRFTGVNAAGLQVYQNLNVTRARTEGIELEARLTKPWLRMTAGYNYLSARDLSNDHPLDGRAAHSARVVLSRTWNELLGVNTDVSAHYTGRAPIGNAEQGALLSIDGQVRCNVTEHVEFAAGVNNLLDQRPALWTPAYERQVFAGVQLHARASVAP